MKRFQFPVLASVLTLAFASNTLAGNISTLRTGSAGNISTLSTGNISTLSTGNISTLSTGNISTLSTGNASLTDGSRGTDDFYLDYLSYFMMFFNL